MRRQRLKQLHSLISEIEEEQERQERDGIYSLFADDNARMAIYEAELREIAGWIDQIPDSQTRRAFRLRYVDGLPWASVSVRMGYMSLDGARKLVMRYLEKTER